MSAYIVDLDTFTALKQYYYTPKNDFAKQDFRDFVHALAESVNEFSDITDDILNTAMHNLAMLNIASVSDRYSDDNYSMIENVDALLQRKGWTESDKMQANRMVGKPGYLYGILDNLYYQSCEISNKDGVLQKFLDALDDYKNKVARSIAENAEGYHWGIDN